MKTFEELEKIVVLIDADNTQLTKLKSILDEISAYGRIVVKKAYGDWKNNILKNWEDELKRLAIKPEQQFAYVTGKNATDIAMVIDSMDLLHTDVYDAFVLVSSDSDFTPLAIRLRESGVHVFGVGEEKTPQSFKNACDDFILVEYLTNAHGATKAVGKAEAEPETGSNSGAGKQVVAVGNSEKININEIHNLLKIAHEKYQDEDGFANMGAVGSYIKRAKPDFNTKMYGFAKLLDLLEHFPKRYEMKKIKGKGKTTVIAYKCIAKKQN